MVTRDSLGHEFHLMRCQRCGVWNHSMSASMSCVGERHEEVEDAWTPSPYDIGSSLGLTGGVPMPMSLPDDTPATPAFEETAFAGGESGGGGAGADFSTPDTSSYSAHRSTVVHRRGFDSGS